MSTGIMVLNKQSTNREDGAEEVGVRRDDKHIWPDVTGQQWLVLGVLVSRSVTDLKLIDFKCRL
jgi:hypothetical protein